MWALFRDVYDHCSLVVKYSSQLWEPKPFWFNNFWLGNVSFDSVVRECLSSREYEGWMVGILKDKLKALKKLLKVWNKEVYGKIDLRIKRCRDNHNIWDQGRRDKLNLLSTNWGVRLSVF